MTYRNPVISGFHPDPSMCRVGDDYYLVTSSFEYFPGVPLFHSKDLVNWQQIGHCLTRKSQLNLHRAGSSGGIYAPTIREHNGTFYMVTTNVSAGGNFYVSTDDPRGEWSDPVFVDQQGIDPDLFFDEDGTVYFTTSWNTKEHGQGAYQSRIDVATGKRLSDVKQLWKGTGGQYPEAPHLFRIGDWYYLLLSEGGTEYGHMVTIARSKRPDGTFRPCPYNPILSHRSLLKSIHATGHADMVQTPEGDWWMVFLGIRPVGYPPKHHLGRETFLAPVEWDEDGWPIVGDRGTIGEVMDARRLKLQPLEIPSIRDGFDDKVLAPEWNFLRSMNTDNWSLADKASCLTLHGSAVTLNDADAVTFVGRRQQHFDMKVSVGMAFAPEQDGEEAGLTVFMNERFHYEIAVTRVAGQRKVIFRRRLGSLWKIENEAPWSADSIVMTVRADKERYTFGFSAGSDAGTGDGTGAGTGAGTGEPFWFGQGECALLSTEVAGGFTGVFIAMYATGNSKPSTTPAHYDWFDYEGK